MHKASWAQGSDALFLFELLELFEEGINTKEFDKEWDQGLNGEPVFEEEN